MLRAIAAVGACAVMLAASGDRSGREVEARPAVAESNGPTQPPAPYSREEIRHAAGVAMWTMCAEDLRHPEFRRCDKLLYDAGDIALPVVAEMVADPKRCIFFVCGAARFARYFSYSPEFHVALRLRREAPEFREPYGAGELAAYFAKFGDVTDLAWMEEVNRSGEKPVDRRVVEAIRILRERLTR